MTHFTDDILNIPGIYVFTREQGGFRFAYVGQSVHCKDRIVEHLHGYDSHIDLSIRKHGLFSEDNPTGYSVQVITYCDISELDTLELKYCLEYANNGYQLRNVTSGSQSSGRFLINECKSSKGYRDGIKKGREDIVNELRKWFKDKDYLTVEISGKATKYKLNAKNKFYQLLALDITRNKN